MGIATAYIAFFVNVPIAILVPSGILSIAAFGTVCLGAVSRFAPGQMAILLPDENDIPKFVPRPTDVDPIPESPQSLPKTRWQSPKREPGPSLPLYILKSFDRETWV